MAKQLVFLKYNFLFDTGELWSNLSQFENSLAEFFAAHDTEARVIKTVEGQIGERIMLIEKKEEAPEVEQPKEGGNVEKPKDVKKRIPKGGKQLPKIRDRKRKFSTKKGYKLAGAKFVKKLGGRK